MLLPFLVAPCNGAGITRSQPTSRSRKQSATSTFRSTRQWLFHVRERIRSDCDDCGIFYQFFRHDIVQRISGSVVIIEVESADLYRTKNRHDVYLQELHVRRVDSDA